MVPLYRSFLFLLLILSSGINSAEKDFDRSAYLSPRPDWVVPESVDLDTTPPPSISDGTYYRLIDKQINITGAGLPGDSAASYLNKQQSQPVRWRRYITELLNLTAVEEQSVVNIDFDPNYHAVTIHQLNIIRGEQVLDRRESAAFQILHREQDAAARIYDGYKTLNIILDDVRVGDKIDLEYSIAGNNPAYDSNVESSFYTSWGVSVQKYHYRLLTDRNRPLDIRQHNQAIDVTTTETNDQITYRLMGENTEPTTYGDRTPSWFDLDSYITFSDMATWEDVVAWIEPAYRREQPASNDIHRIAESIRQQHESTDDQIIAALQWVQSEIRYLGIELGAGSHIPSPAETTLQRRFGDCKDKTVLLITLLDALGVNAQPALVHTRQGHGLPNKPARMHAFNHVIAHVDNAGKSHWLDPTLTHQNGTLGTLHEPDYGYALILSPDTKELSDMASDVPLAEHYDKRIVSKVISIPQDLSNSVSNTQKTVTTGRFADDTRYYFDNDSKRTIQEQYARYYTRYYGSTEFTDDITLTEQPLNAVAVEENYEHTEYWARDEDDPDTPYTWLYANEARDYLNTPSDINDRQTPYNLGAPTQIEESIIVKTPYSVPAYTDTYTKNTDYFLFTRTVRTDPPGRQIFFDVNFRTLKRSVPADQIKAHHAAITEARDQTYILLGGDTYLGDTEEEVSSDTSADTAMADFDEVRIYFFYLGLILTGLSLMVFSFIMRSMDDSTHSDAIFHPVSLLKFNLMTLISFGIYQALWAWRVFRYEKKVLGKRITPFIRTAFLVIFFYGMAQSIREYAIEHGVKTVYSKAQSIVMAILYLCSMFASSYHVYLLPVAILAVALTTAPLVHQVNVINRAGLNTTSDNSPSTQEDTMTKNSGVSLGSVGLALISIPTALLMIGLAANFL